MNPVSVLESSRPMPRRVYHAGIWSQHKLLAQVLHKITPLVVVLALAAWSLNPKQKAYGADDAIRPNILIILADDKY